MQLYKKISFASIMCRLLEYKYKHETKKVVHKKSQNISCISKYRAIYFLRDYENIQLHLIYHLIFV